MVVPDWYVPCAERAKVAEESRLREEAVAAEQAAVDAREQEKAKASDVLWNSLSAEQRGEYRMKALAGLPSGMEPSKNISVILAKTLA